MVTASTPTFNHNSAPDTRPPIASSHIMRKAQRLIVEDRQEDLLPFLEKQIAHFPQDAYLRLLLAGTYTKMGDRADRKMDIPTADRHYKTALTHTLAGLVTKPHDVRLLCHAGDTLRRLGHYGEGEAFYQRALRQDNTDVHTWTALGKLLRRWSEDTRPAIAMTPDKRLEIMMDSAACYAAAEELDPENRQTLSVLSSFAFKGIKGTENGYDYRGGGPDKALRAIERFAARQAAAHPLTGAVLAPASP